MDIKIVNRIVEFVMRTIDWELLIEDSDCFLAGISIVLDRDINTVVNDAGIAAVVQCNGNNNVQSALDAGEIHIGIMLVDSENLTTETIRATAKIDIGVVTVTFEENWL